MLGSKKTVRFVIALLALAVLAAAPEPMQSNRLEAGTDSNIVSVLGRLIGKLPKIGSVRREARRIAATLPAYDGPVKTPDSETIFSWIAELCATPHRRPGTAEDHRAENLVADRFREFGLEQVTLDPVPITVWTATSWSLTVAGREVPAFYTVNTGFTGPQGVSAGLVYVGTGKRRDFERADVKGKIVVADVPFPKMPYGLLLKTLGAAYAVSDPDGYITASSSQYLNFVRQNFIGGTDAETAPAGDVYWQSYRRGAVGILLILRDQPSNSNTHYGPYDGIMKPLPALWIGKYDGDGLRAAAKAGETATLTLAGNTAPGVMHNVWGTLPGKSEEVILVTSHHDAPFTGAVEDGAGTAQVLAQAWAWSKVPREKRPKTLVFVVDGGHFYGSLGGHAFARQHPEIMARASILITLEHLGGKEVTEKDRGYAFTGRPAFTVMFTSNDPRQVAAIVKTFKRRPPRMTASIPFDFLGPAPTSDAAGYVLESKVPVISWIGCPYYLLDEGDTLDKIEVRDLQPIADTVAELIGIQMMMKK